MQYVKIMYEIDININFLCTEHLDRYIMSTDQLVLTGDIIQTRWDIKGKKIGLVKTMMLDEIFHGRLVNEKEQLISYVNKIYLTLD
jgi:hypothetical protein